MRTIAIFLVFLFTNIYFFGISYFGMGIFAFVFVCIVCAVIAEACE